MKLRFFFIALVCTLLLLIWTHRRQPDTNRSPIIMSVGDDVQEDFGDYGEHAFEIYLKKGFFSEIEVMQKRVDVIVTVYGPQQNPLFTVDSPNLAWGPEKIAFVAEQTGPYRMVVKPFAKNGNAGHFVIRVVQIKPASLSDRREAEALALFIQAGDQQDSQKYLKAASLWEEMDDPLRQGFSWQQWAELQMRSGHHQLALEGFEKAEKYYREAQQSRLVVDMTLQSSRPLYELGRIELAENALQKTIAMAQEPDLQDLLAMAHNNAGLFYHRRGRFNEALSQYDQALPIWRQLKELREEANTLQNCGATYLHVGSYRDAEDYLTLALTIWEELGSVFRQASVYMHLGWLHYRESHFEKAEALFRRALEICRINNFHRLESAVNDRLGSLLRDSGRFKEANACYQKALNSWGSDPSQDRAHTHLNLASLLIKQGDFFGAEAYLDEANGLFLKTEQTNALIHTKFLRAQIFEHRQQWDSAEVLVEEMLAEIFSMRDMAGRRNLRNDLLTSRINYFEYGLGFYARCHKIYPELNYTEKSLALYERIKAQGFLDSLQRQESERNAFDIKLSARQTELRRQLHLAADRYDLASQNIKSEELAHISQEIRRLRREHDSFNEIEYEPTTFSSVLEPGSETAGLLDSETIILVYYLGDKFALLWSIDCEGLTLHELDNAQRINLLTKQIFRRAIKPITDPTLEHHIHRLSRLILEPVSERLRFKKRLGIVSDGPLEIVPFQILKNENRPLVTTHRIMRVPSLSSLAFLRERRMTRRHPHKTIAIFANPVFSSSDSRILKSDLLRSDRSLSEGPQYRLLHRSMESIGLKEIPSLPYSGLEAEAIAKMVPKSQRHLAEGFDANLLAVKSGKWDQFRYLHFATHSILNYTAPELSGIVLSLVDPQGNPLRGFLRASDIEPLSLASDLVVLSTCKSAMSGISSRGGGPMGLPRAFLGAGAKSVLVSLWQVDDHSTSQLMTLFYHQLLKLGKPPAEALRTAQLEMSQYPQWSAPYFWAGFVLVGDWE